MTDNSNLSRFERIENDRLVFASYRRDEDILVITYVEADPLLRGSGATGRLMDDVLAMAREQGLRIRPVCGYAAAYLRRQPGTSDLLV